LKGVSRALLIILGDKVEASQEDKTNGWFRKMKNTWRI
jgi:hypothetical protein